MLMGMAGPFGIPFNVTEVDGVPLFWADAPGRGAAGLLFRVGRADESLAGAGVTHLVQELVLRALGAQHSAPARAAPPPPPADPRPRRAQARAGHRRAHPRRPAARAALRRGRSRPRVP